MAFYAWRCRWDRALSDSPSPPESGPTCAANAEVARSIYFTDPTSHTATGRERCRSPFSRPLPDGHVGGQRGVNLQLVLHEARLQLVQIT